MCQQFFHEESIYGISCTVLDERTHARMHGQPETNMPRQLLLSWCLTRAGVYVTLCPQHMLASTNSKFENSKVKQAIYFPSPINSLFQAPSSNSFRDTLLTSLKFPNLQRATTPGRIYSKVNQVIYSSSPIS